MRTMIETLNTCMDNVIQKGKTYINHIENENAVINNAIITATRPRSPIVYDPGRTISLRTQSGRIQTSYGHTYDMGVCSSYNEA